MMKPDFDLITATLREAFLCSIRLCRGWNVVDGMAGPKGVFDTCYTVWNDGERLYLVIQFLHSVDGTIDFGINMFHADICDHLYYVDPLMYCDKTRDLCGASINDARSFSDCVNRISHVVHIIMAKVNCSRPGC